MNKDQLAFNNLQWFIFRKTKRNQTNQNLKNAFFKEIKQKTLRKIS